MGPDPAPSKGKEKESPFQFYAYLGSVSFKPHYSQNSAPLLENNAVIKLLLRGQNISSSPAFRKNWAQTKSSNYGLDKPKSPNQLQTSTL